MVSLVLAAALATACPNDASLGTVTFVRAANLHQVTLGDCVDHTVSRASQQRRLALLSPDGTSAASFDRGGSASLAADGVVLRVFSLTTGRAHNLGVGLAYPDYVAWCGGRLIFTGGGDRVATHSKRLLIAAPPDWKPRPLWNAPTRSFGSLACAPDGGSVAVLSQLSSTNANFFATRWQLWRVGLDGSHSLLDSPPPGYADESPLWIAGGRALAFVRERDGKGALVLLRNGRISAPIASLGFRRGYYGHRDWQLTWHA